MGDPEGWGVHTFDADFEKLREESPVCDELIELLEAVSDAV